MAEQNAWVTLATNDSYCLGALVLAHSLRRVGTKYQIAILITPTVSEIMKARLATVFSQVTLVDVLDSKDAAHLSLLARPELGITFTKLHCWNLTQYKKCVFLDADTLVLQNSDELFEREEFSAAPDVGWPDCFNSGVFVFQPSKETFEALIKFAQEKGSFDGGDQGLLNQYFSDWARGDINKHLPFLYNVCSTAFYSYLPAFKQFGADTKIMHFIGSVKPWMQKFNWASRTVSEEGHLQAPSQTWWNIFLENVHPCLDAGMARWECGASNEARYYTPHNDQSSFPWHHIPPPDIEQPPSAVPHSAEFYDPWETYAPAPADVPASTSSRCSSISDDSVIRIHETFETAENVEPPITYPPKPWYETYIPEVVQSNDEEEWHDSLSHLNDSNIPCGPGGSHCGTVSYNFNFECPTSEASKSNDWQRLDEDPLNEEVSNITSDIMKNDEEQTNKPLFEEVIPRHPYDNYYLLHKTVLDDHGSKRCTHEELPPAPSPSPTPSVDTEPDLQTGIAGALSQLTIGTSEQGSAVEEHLRRQGWETGNIDYMGADSFDNILAKISQTLSSPPEQPASDSSASNVLPTEVPSPVAAPAVLDPLPELAPGSKIVICPIQPAPVEVTPTEVAPVAPVVAAPETKTKIESVTQESQATTDEKQDSKQAETNTTDISMSTPCEVPPSKPFEKLVCHLKPTEGVDPLVTPENEHEEAASIAMRIIASEEALSSPIITSATPPISTPTHPAIPQNIKDLAIDTRIPETPPVPGPVSLAQIGILPLEQPSSLSDIAEKCELPSGKDEPSEALKDSPVAEPIVKEDATKPVETVPVSKDEPPKTDETTPIVDDIKADSIVKEASIDEPPKSSETDAAPAAEVEAVPKVEEKIEPPKPEEPATPAAVPEVVQKEEEKITPLEAEVPAATVAVVEAVKEEEDKIEAPKQAEPVATVAEVEAVSKEVEKIEALKAVEPITPVAEVEAVPKEESPKSPEPVATVAEVEATPKEESPKSPELVATVAEVEAVPKEAEKIEAPKAAESITPVAEVEAAPKEESSKSPEPVATVAEVETVPKEVEKIEAPKTAESITPVAEVEAAPKEESPKSPEPATAVVEAEITSKKTEEIEASKPAEPVVAVVEAAIAPKEAKEVEAPKAVEPATPVAEVQAALKEEQKVEPVAEITVKKVVVKTKAAESPKVETSAVAEPIPEVKAAPKKKVKKEKPELPKTSEPVTPVAEVELTLKKEEKTEPPKAETEPLKAVKEPVTPTAEIKVALKKDKKEKPELPKVEPAEPAISAKDIKLELSTKKSDPLESPKAQTDLPADNAAPAVKTVKRVVKKPQPVPESDDSKKVEVSADKEKSSEKPLEKKDDASTKEVPAEAVPKPRKVIKKVVKTVPVAKSDSKDETVLKKKADAPPTPVSEPKDSPISEVVSKEKTSVESVVPKDDTKPAIKEADATVKPKKVFKKPPTLLAKSDVAEDTETKKAEDIPVPPPRKKEKKVEKK